MTKWTGRLDRVTGLYDRVLLEAMLKHEVAQTQRYGNPLALMRVALYNPPPAEDENHLRAISLVAQVLNMNLRAADMPGHHEEEFLILLPYTDASSAMAVATRLIEAVNALPASKPGLDLSICVGIVTTAGDSDMSPDTSLVQAEAALTEAKRRGAGSIVEYGKL